LNLDPVGASDQFVPRDEIDDLYINWPYYIVPDGKVGQQAFAVIREAIRKHGMVAFAWRSVHALP
jgi:DNA end-binding protein Ku